VYKALQDKDCRHWVDSVMDKLSFKEKVGQLFIYTIAPVDTKRNLELLREVIDTYKVGGLLFSGGKMQNQVELTNRAQRQAKVPLMITFDGIIFIYVSMSNQDGLHEHHFFLCA
jgi:hypothetical protein